MAEKTYLAVDLGAESGRVMAGRFDGKTISLEQFHRFGNGPVNLAGTLRWNLVGLWSEIQNGLREAASRLNGSAVSVGVDTWGVDFVLIHQNKIDAPCVHPDGDRRTVQPRSSLAQTVLYF